MSYVMNVVFKAKDEISPYLNNIGNNGRQVVAGLEEDFVNANSAMSQTAKSISDISTHLSSFSGGYSTAVSQTEQFTAVISDESEELRKNAQSSQIKADQTERAATLARMHYEEIQKKIQVEGEASEALKKSASEALQEAETLEKCAEAWRKEAVTAEQSYLAIGNNKQAITAISQAEEKAAEAISKADTAMSNTAKTATETTASFSKLAGNTDNIAAQSRLLADALAKEAERLERASEKAHQKADMDSQAAKSAKEFYESLKKQSMESDNVADALEEQTAQALRVSESLDKVAKKSEEKAKAMEKAAAAVRTNASAAEESAKADEELYGSANKVYSVEQKVADTLNKAEQEAEEYAKAANKAADENVNLAKNGESAAQLLESAFMALGVERVLLKIKDAFVDCSKSAIEFESAITGVYKTVDGTDEQLEKISNDIKIMSIEIPSTTTEIAGVAESAGQLGIATNDITDFTKVMINLGEATNLTSDEAASSLAKFANITGMSASNYENLGSAVVVLGNNFATTEADIVAMSTRMASAGTLAGLTESDILGLATAMSSVGIEADAGGSAMSKLLSDIQVAVETGNDSLNDFASVAGMTVERFSDLFKNRAVDALSAFISGLNDVERNGQTATVILENMGITEVRLSNAVKSLASNSDGMSSAIRLASDAWQENTALAQEAGTRYGTLESRLTIAQNAANNLKIAIGDDLSPAIGRFADIGTNVLTWMTGFIDKHPSVTAGITGVSVAIGVGAVAVGGFTLAVNVAKPAVDKLTAAMNRNPLFLAVSVGASVIAGIVAFTAVISSNEEKVEDYNGTLEQCRNELDNTAMAYKNVCDMYGANSEAAQSLKSELDMLNAQYQKGGGFAEDYAQRLSESKEAFASFKTEYNEKIAAVDDSWQSGMVAVAQLDALSEKAQITNSDLDLMSNYADYLNDTFNCNIEVDYDTKTLTGFDPTDINSQMEKIVRDKRKQSASDYITGDKFTNKYIDTYRDYQEAAQKLSELEMEIEKAASDPGYVNTTGWKFNDYEKLTDEIAGYENTLKGCNNEIMQSYSQMGYGAEEAENYIDILKGISSASDDAKDSAEDLMEAMTPKEIASIAWSNHKEEIEELCEAYNEAYTSIRGSLDGMFELFETAQMNFDNTLSVDGAVEALQSQIEYFEQYEEAVKKLSELGLDNNIIEQLDPAQAVAFADELNSIDTSDAQRKISELNEKAKTLSSVKDEAAQTMAGFNDELNQKMDEALRNMETDIATLIKEMNASTGARSAGDSTMTAYSSAISSGGDAAVLAAQSVVSRVNAVLASANTTINVGMNASGSLGIAGHATGTTNAEDIFIAGEEGPELIVGKKGSTVFPADETNRIISAVNESYSSDVPVDNANEASIYSGAEAQGIIYAPADKPLYVPPVDFPISRQIEKVSETTSRKEISININGSGSVQVTGGMNKDDILEVMWEYFKPVLAGIIEQESFEEGDSSYDY